LGFWLAGYFLQSACCCKARVVAKRVLHSGCERKNAPIGPIASGRARGGQLHEPKVERSQCGFFDDTAAFDVMCDRLAAALQFDMAWGKGHTRLGERARLWDDAGRPKRARLLSRPEVAEAVSWRHARPANAPVPTDLIHAYIAASQANIA